MVWRSLSLAIAAAFGALGCAHTPTGPVRTVAVGSWGFSGIGDDGAEHVFQVMVLPLRDGQQGARIKGVIGGAGLTRIRPLGAATLEELALEAAIPGSDAPAIFRWEVEGLDLQDQPVRAEVTVTVPRLPAQVDPGDTLARARIDQLDLEAHADIVFPSGRRAFAKGVPPIEEPIFMDDPYARHTDPSTVPDPLWDRERGGDGTDR